MYVFESRNCVVKQTYPVAKINIYRILLVF